MKGHGFMPYGYDRVLQRLAAGAPWVAGGKALTVACVVLSNVILARLLKPAELGTYFFLISLASVGSVFARLGVAQTGLRLTASALGAGRPDAAWRSVLSSLSWTALGVMLTATLFCSIGALCGLDSGTAATLAALSGALAFLSVTTELLRGCGRIGAASVCCGPFNHLLFTALLLICLFMDKSLTAAQVLVFPAAAAAAALLAAGAILYKGRESAGFNPERLESYIPGAVMPAALPILVSSLTLTALSQADIWILVHMLPRADVALYGAMARMAAAVSLPLLIVNLSLAPTMAEYHIRGDACSLEKGLRDSATVVSLLSLALVAVIAVAGKPLIGAIFGDFYREGHYLLLVLGIGQLAVAATGSCGSVLIMGGHQRIYMKITVLTAVMTLAAASVLIRAFGTAGLATAMAAGTICQNILVLFAARRLVGIWTHFRTSPSIGRRGAESPVE